MEKTNTCISCNTPLMEVGSVKFRCPVCDTWIGRCRRCRKQSVQYTCPNCSFTGP